MAPGPFEVPANAYGVIQVPEGDGWSSIGAFATVGPNAASFPNTERWQWDSGQTPFPSPGFRIVSAAAQSKPWSAMQPRGSFETSLAVSPITVGSGDVVFEVRVSGDGTVAAWLVMVAGASLPLWYGNPAWSGWATGKVLPLPTHVLTFAAGGTVAAAVYPLIPVT